jgi:acetolactate synthase-1/2/3 large subunit
MKVADYIAEFIQAQGVNTVFGLTGGAVVHLFDAIDQKKTIKTVFCHHEQAAALAAVAYARIKNDMGVAIITTGPGGTNAVTGVTAAWQDSIPCLFISGQARLAQVSYGKGLRQLGTQELDIVSIVKSITKYAALVESPQEIRYHLEKAVAIARSGRPGPVWVDVPLDIQMAQVDPEKSVGFQRPKAAAISNDVQKKITQCQQWLSQAQRPLVLLGYGTRLSKAEKECKEFIEKFQLPFVSTWTASDILPTQHPLYLGRIGSFGQRGANLAIQNCDFLLSLGSHLSIPLTGGVFKAFARGARVAMIDIDKKELSYKTVKVDLPIEIDVKEFLKRMILGMKGISLQQDSLWKEKRKKYLLHNRIPKEWFGQKKFVNSYVFLDTLSKLLKGQEMIVVDGGGTNLFTSFQAFKVKGQQRLTTSSGICAMGTGLPESVGACFAHQRKTTICLTGDGSMQFNIHELQTIVHHGLPIKIFVINNRGYLAIRHTQDEFLKSRYVGSFIDGGMSLPNIVKVAKAYGLPALSIRSHKELVSGIKKTLLSPGPFVCEVMISPEQPVYPRTGFRQNANNTFSASPLEDMFPFLKREELKKDMFIALWDDGHNEHFGSK